MLRGEYGLSMLTPVLSLWSTQVVWELVRGGYSWAMPEDLMYASMEAVARSHIRVIQALRKAGWQVADPVHQLYLLYRAVLACDVAMVELLLAYGYAPHGRFLVEGDETMTNHTLLHVACRTATVSVLRALLEHGGMDVETLDGQGLTPLEWCLRNEPYDLLVIPYLVDYAGAKTDYLSALKQVTLRRSLAEVKAMPVREF